MDNMNNEGNINNIEERENAINQNDINRTKDKIISNEISYIIQTIVPSLVFVY